MSIWGNKLKKPVGLKLTADTYADVVIIGGGMAGILTAYELKSRGVDCMVLEKGEIGMGVTKNTTAKVTSQHNLIHNEIIKSYGHGKAEKYLSANQNAIEKYRKLCNKLGCKFENRDAYVYSETDSTQIEKEANALASLGFKAEVTSDTNLPFPIAAALKFPAQGQINPLELIYSAAKHLEIYQNIEAVIISQNRVKANGFTINCKYIVVTTHFPFVNKYGMYFLKMYQDRSYILALKNAMDVKGMYIAAHSKGLSFRNYEDLLLVGGEGHRTGKCTGGYDKLKEKSSALFPKAEIVSTFATEDCMTLDKIPYIGRYSKLTPKIFVATGFNKWGMTSSMVASEIISDLITKGKSEYEDVFTPARLRANKQLFINIGSATAGLVNFKTKRCSHMGCALNYNKQEHSWDCPCHGSRFDEKGNVINNPAKKKINI